MSSRLKTLRRSFHEVHNSPKEDRRRTLGLCVGYATFTLLRKCFSVATPYMGFNKVELGTIATAYNISYGSAKFVGGILCDGFPAEVFFACALFLAGISNIGFAFSANLSVLCTVWFFAGATQGFGWPALGQIVMQRYEPLHIGTVWSVVITAGNLGYLIAPFLLLPFLGYGWQATFFVCGFAGLVISVMVFVLLSPDNKNNIMKALPIPSQNESVTEKQSSWQAWISIACNFNLWLIIFSNCLTVFVLTGLASWFSLYLIEEYKASPGRAAELMLWTEVGGLIGSLFCGSVSDRLGGRRCLTCLIFTLMCLPAFWWLPSPSLYLQQPKSTNSLFYGLYSPSLLPESLFYQSIAWLSMIIEWLSGCEGMLRLCLFLLGCGINGPKTLLSIAVRDAVSKDILGAAGGVFGLVGQVGASASGYGLGLALQLHGWNGYLTILSHGTTALALLLTILTFSLTAVPTKGKQE